MGIVLFGLAVFSALLTWNAFHPATRPAALAAVSFFAGWYVDELALHHVFGQALTVLFILWRGGGSADGWAIAGGAIFVASWVGLWVRFEGARSAAIAMEAALRDTLGADLAAADAAHAIEPPADSDTWRLVMPFPNRHESVESTRGIRYRSVGGIDLKLDIHRSRSHPTGAPVLVYVHGGGWTIGFRERQGLPLMQHLAARGWVCASVGYRLSPRATFPEHLHDVKAGIAWVREHIAEYGGDPAFIVIAGGSAGGHLAALAALTSGDASLQPGFEGADTHVDGCVPIYGIYDFLDRDGLWPHRGFVGLLERLVMKSSAERDPKAWDRASPIAHVKPDAPPFLVVHGSSDTMVPVATARRFADTLGAVSHAPVVYAEIPGAQHAFDQFPSRRSLAVVRGIARFVEWLYQHHRAGKKPASVVAEAIKEVDAIAP